MPDYTDTPGYRPSDSERSKALWNEHEKKQVDRHDAARNNLKNTVKPGPAERMYGQDRPTNQNLGEARSATQKQLTPAQQEMKLKREEARKADRAELDKPYSDRTIGRLPQSQDRGR